MGALLEDQTGKVYNNLLIRLDLSEAVKDKVKFVLAQCFLCDNMKKYRLSNLRNGSTKSCGCSKVIHGFWGCRQYKSWEAMKQRCSNPKATYYYNYGGRGIRYDLKWETFEGFWKDMGEGYSDDLTLDRVDNNGNYTKDNCKWSNKVEQAYNQRKQKNNTTGKTGVSFNTSRGKYIAIIYKASKQIYLGDYKTFGEAVKVREDAELEYFGGLKGH